MTTPTRAEAVERAASRIKAVSLQHHGHEESAALLHALLVDVPAAVDEEFAALRRGGEGAS